VKKQLGHMVRFIEREAEEKANEIMAKALEEFSIEKSRIVQEEKLKIMKEYERKEKMIEVKKKIMVSNELNSSRLRILKARDENLMEIKGEAKRRLGLVDKDPVHYKNLLYAVVFQGLMRLQEPKVSVIGRKQDHSLIKEILPSLAVEYKAKTSLSVVLELSTFTLPNGPQEGQRDGDYCCGGVVLSTNEGRIMSSNTVDARLEMAYEGTLPQIRTILFGESKTRKHRD